MSHHRPSLRSCAIAALAALVAACAAISFARTSVASAAVTPGVAPDFVLSAQQRTANKDVSSILITDLTPQADPAVTPTPDQCRDLAALDAYCDVYRFKIDRDTTKGASNFVQVLVEWPAQVQTPALALAVAGLSNSDQPDIDLFLYETADTYVDYEMVGGRGAIVPERIVWEATQDEYDLVVRSGTGLVTEYSIHARYSDEIFGRPFEILDELSDQGPSRFENPGDEPAETPAPAIAPPPLALAPVDVDEQIAGIGLGTTEQFDVQDGFALGSSRAVATSEPPSTLVLILAMLLFPLAAGSGAFLMLRRRRNSFAE